ncbi:hypothetical protein, partial [Mesorhizobium sp. M0500]|uniref:hypothetical protein n=1 Tax=Mesorhizobium sp. M0500 TaxID=2956953 RepID=UPI00333BCA5B
MSPMTMDLVPPPPIERPRRSHLNAGVRQHGENSTVEMECAPRTGRDEQAELTWKPGFRRMEAHG